MKNKLILMVLLLCCIDVFAQDNTVFFSQILKEQDMYNPAYNAHKHNLNAKLIYNSKLSGLKGNPELYSLSVSIPLVSSEFGTFVNVFNENIGLRKIWGLNTGLSTCLKMSESSYLSAGISVGYRKLGYDKTRIKLVDYFENYENNISDESKITFGFGFFYFNRTIFAGASVSDVAVNDVSFFSNYDLYGGFNSWLGDLYTLKSAVLLKRFYGENILHFNETLYYHDKIGIGAQYSVNKDWGVNFEIKILPNVWIGYLYESLINKEISGIRSHSLKIRYGVNSFASLFRKGNKLRNIYF